MYDLISRKQAKTFLLFSKSFRVNTKAKWIIAEQAEHPPETGRCLPRCRLDALDKVGRPNFFTSLDAGHQITRPWHQDLGAI